MKIFPIFFCILLTGCTGQVTNETTSRSKNFQPKELCFQLLQGTQNQDTTHLKLHIHGTSVSGEFNYLPEEKDARRGTLQGTIKKDTISAMWHFVQEGIQDSILMKFKLNDNNLLQKNLSVDPNTGRQYTDDSSDYTVEYQKIACKD